MQRAYAPRGLRFLPKLTLAITAGMITAVASYAADVFTDPVGFVTLTAQPSGLSFVSLPMTQLPVQKGLITSITGTTVTDSSGNWTNNQFSSGIPYEIEFTQPVGSTNLVFKGWIDQIVGSTGPGTLVTANDDSSFINNAYGYTIRPSWTPDTVFGPPAQSGIAGGTTAAGADNVFVWDPVNQTPVTYWYRSNSATPGWRGPQGTGTPAGTNALAIYNGIEIQRKTGATPTNIVLVGAVKLGQTINLVYPGLTYAGYVYASGFTFNTIGLYTTNNATGVAGGTTAAGADNVFVWDPINQTPITYWYRSNSATPGWRGPQGTGTDAGTNQIPLGAMLKIQRKTLGGFDWFMQQPY
jgi:hypothetical protein